MADNDKDWLVRLDSPFFPAGLSITRMASTDELRDVLATVRQKLPEWRAETIDINTVMRDLDKAAKSEDKKR